MDPITSNYPMLTPYQFASNRPVDGVDQDGLEWLPVGPGNFLWDIAMEWVFGDPTGAKEWKAGVEKKAAIEQRRMPYHEPTVS